MSTSDEKIIDFILQDIIEMSTDEIKQEAHDVYGSDYPKVVSETTECVRTIFNSSKRKQRLVETKNRSILTKNYEELLELPIEELLAKVRNEAVSHGMTVAFRDLSKFSKEELVKIYHQIKKIKNENI